MKILHLYTNLNITCGITKTIYLIAKNLNDEVEQIIYSSGGDAVSKFKEAGLNLAFSTSTSHGIINSTKTINKLLRLIKTNNIDILHSHHRYYDLLAFIISTFCNVKTITSVQSKVSGKKNISYNSQYLVACSKSIKEHLIKYFEIDPAKISVIHNFVDINEINRCDDKILRRDLNIPDDSVLIGFVGRFSIREKGIDYLLESFKKLSSAHNNISFLLLGGGEDINYVYKYIDESGINAQVILSKGNVYDYLQLMNIVVLPSRVEPFGIVSIEAGIMRKAFIGSNVDGLPEIIDDGKNGILIPSGSVEELVQSISSLIEKPELRKKYGDALYEKVLNNFTSEKIIPLYKKLYENVMSK